MATNVFRGASWPVKGRSSFLSFHQAPRLFFLRPQRLATPLAAYNSELNATTLDKHHKEFPTDGSNFPPCEWKDDDQKSSTARNRFGKTYAEMKQAIITTMASPPMTDDEKRILVAIAMIESPFMDSKETVSIYNLSHDMLGKAGYPGPYNDWDTDEHAMDHLSEATLCVLQYLRGSSNATRLPSNANFGWSNGEAALNIVRGGIGAWAPCDQPGFHNTGCYDEHSWIIDIYRRSIATMVKCMEDNPAYLTNNTRIVIDCPHYG